MEQDERAAADITGGHGPAVSQSDEEDDTEVIFDSSGGASGSEFRSAPFMIPFLGSSSEQEALTEKSSSSEVITPVSNAGQHHAFGCSSQNEDHEMPKRNHPATTHYGTVSSTFVVYLLDSEFLAAMDGHCQSFEGSDHRGA